jgi:hypothetical protein
MIINIQEKQATQQLKELEARITLLDRKTGYVESQVI